MEPRSRPGVQVDAGGHAAPAAADDKIDPREGRRWEGGSLTDPLLDRDCD